MAQTTKRQKEQRQVRQVTVGDYEISVGRISGYKFELALNIISQVMQEQERVQDSLDAFVQQTQQKGSVRIYKEEKDLPAYSHYGLTDEHFGSNEYVDVQRQVSGSAVFFHLFPLIWEVARDKLLAVLAVIAIEDSDLRQTWEEYGDEGVSDRLNDVSRDLRFEGDIEELMELFIVGGEAIKQRWDSKRDRLGKLGQAMAANQQSDQSQGSSTEQTIGSPKPGGLVSPGPSQQTDNGHSTETSNSESQNSSTHSQESMGGLQGSSSST